MNPKIGDQFEMTNDKGEHAVVEIERIETFPSIGAPDAYLFKLISGKLKMVELPPKEMYGKFALPLEIINKMLKHGYLIKKGEKW